MVQQRQGRNRKVPPSRARYEASHPTVTVRVDQALYDELKGLKEKEGLSVADVLKIGLEKSQATTKTAHDAGFAKGWKSATAKYEVTYFCSRCGDRHLAVSSDEEREEVAQLMYEAGWHSPSCVEG